MKYNRINLQEQFYRKANIKFLFFWGHQPSKDGSVTKSCFSQWWPSVFNVDGIAYKTAEHYMMAEKARLFNDDEQLKAILESNHPMKAKQLGRQVRNFKPEIWDKHKYEIVKQGNYYKFSQNKDLKEVLINTKNRVLVESSPRDRIWGIGMTENNEKCHNPSLWRGENLLGFALMEVRDKMNEKN